MIIRYVPFSGPLAFSMIPVVGVYSDFRDMSKELLKLWPGGEDPNWIAFGFSAAGIAGEFFGPGDAVFDIGKQMAVHASAANPVWLAFLALARKANVDKIREYLSIWTRYITDSGFRGLAETSLIVRL